MTTAKSHDLDPESMSNLFITERTALRDVLLYRIKSVTSLCVLRETCKGWTGFIDMEIRHRLPSWLKATRGLEGVRHMYKASQSRNYSSPFNSIGIRTELEALLQDGHIDLLLWVADRGWPIASLAESVLTPEGTRFFAAISARPTRLWARRHFMQAMKSKFRQLLHERNLMVLRKDPDVDITTLDMEWNSLYSQWHPYFEQIPFERGRQWKRSWFGYNYGRKRDDDYEDYLDDRILTIRDRDLQRAELAEKLGSKRRQDLANERLLLAKERQKRDLMNKEFHRSLGVALF
jgi:hypothetical protein